MPQPIQQIVTNKSWIGLTLLAGSFLMVLAMAVGILPEGPSQPPRTVHFQVGTRLSADGEAAIAAAATDLAKNPGLTVLVTGHSGAGGDPDANLDLSRRRASVVRDALVASGIDADRILALGAGSSMTPPRDPEESDMAYASRLKRATLTLRPRRSFADEAAR